MLLPVVSECKPATHPGGRERAETAELGRAALATVDGQAVHDREVHREDRQRPERIGGDREQGADRAQPGHAMPNQRPNWPPLQIEKAARICRTPRMRVTQPQVFRLLRMYF